MTRPRSIFPGDTDYTGVPLPDILDHFRDWSNALSAETAHLASVRRRLEAFISSSVAKDGLEYVDCFRDLFNRYRSDIDRVIAEIPAGVLPRHVETVRQIYRSSRTEELLCVDLKRRHYLDALNERDRVQNELAEIYRHTRDALINLRDLSNVVARLETYVQLSPGGPQQASGVNALELKPNFMGIGVNVNYIWERWGLPAIRRWLRR